MEVRSAYSLTSTLYGGGWVTFKPRIFSGGEFPLVHIITNNMTLYFTPEAFTQLL